MRLNFFQKYIHSTERHRGIHNFFKLLGKVYLHLFPVRIRGCWFYMNPNDISVAIQFFLGVYESYSTLIFSRLVKKGMVVCDIGAHVGLYSIIGSKLVGTEGKIYSFEPDIKNNKNLKENIKLNNCNNVYPYEVAITSRKGNVKLFLSENSQDHRLINFKGSKRSYINVMQDSLDNILDKQKVDIIKIDIQGAEEECIKGMKKIINRNDNLIIMMEFWPEGLKYAGTDPLSFLKTMSKKFQIYMLDEIKLRTVLVDNFSKLLIYLEKVEYVNLLYKRKIK